MPIIYLDPKNPPNLLPIALTLGNFDGVHLGHQAMLHALHQDAQRLSLQTAVMIFEPQPREFFNPDNPPARLTNLNEKINLLQDLGVDFILVADFNQAFRLLSAHEFGGLLQRLNAQFLVIGDDFRFGHDRTGDRAFLQDMGFAVDSLATVSHSDKRISSTAVRQALAQGDLTTAKALLGRDYTITGEVVHGDKIGRTLNFPTANIALNRTKPALQGVFGADIFAFKDGQTVSFDALAVNNQIGITGTQPNSLWGAVNIGTRPSVNGQDYRLEVHLPEFFGNLYGLTLQVVFKHFLHDEKKYPDLNSLQTAIAQDVNELIQWRNTFIIK